MESIVLCPELRDFKFPYKNLILQAGVLDISVTKTNVRNIS